MENDQSFGEIQGNDINVTLLYIVDNTQRFQQPSDEIVF